MHESNESDLRGGGDLAFSSQRCSVGAGELFPMCDFVALEQNKRLS